MTVFRKFQLAYQDTPDVSALSRRDSPLSVGGSGYPQNKVRLQHTDYRKWESVQPNTDNVIMFRNGSKPVVTFVGMTCVEAFGEEHGGHQCSQSGCIDSAGRLCR